MTVLRVVSDLDRSRHFYRDVLGAREIREYGGTSAVLQIAGAWLLLVTGGGPTPDKPTVIFAPPASPDVVSDELTFTYEALKSRGGDISHSTARVRLGDPLLLSRSRRTPAGDQSVQSPV